MSLPPAQPEHTALLIKNKPVSYTTTAPCLDANQIPEKDKLTVTETISSLASSVVGTGMLFLPYGFHLSGYFTVVLILGMVIIMGFTGLLVGYSLELADGSSLAKVVPKKNRDFGFLAQVAFGKKGRVFIDAVVAVEVWFTLVSFTVMTAENLNYLANIHVKLGVIVVCVVAAIMSFIPMRAFAYVSGLSTVVLFGFIALFGLHAFIWVPFPEWSMPTRQNFARPENFARTLGLIVFALDAHPCFPAIHQCMVEQDKWRECILVSFSVAFIALGGFGFFAFELYGNSLLPNLTGNFHTSWLKKTVALVFIFKILSVTPLFLNTLLVALKCAPEEIEDSDGTDLAVGKESRAIELPCKEVLGIPRKSLHMIGLVAVTGLTAAAAIFFVENLDVIVSIGGCALITIHAIIFPTLTYMRLNSLAWSGRVVTKKLGQSFSVGMNLPCALALLAGVVIAGCGTTANIIELASNRMRP